MRSNNTKIAVAGVLIALPIAAVGVPAYGYAAPGIPNAPAVLPAPLPADPPTIAPPPPAPPPPPVGREYNATEDWWSYGSDASGGGGGGG